MIELNKVDNSLNCPLYFGKGTLKSDFSQVRTLGSGLLTVWMRGCPPFLNGTFGKPRSIDNPAAILSSRNHLILNSQYPLRFSESPIAQSIMWCSNFPALEYFSTDKL
jgi:hypothetical protein